METAKRRSVTDVLYGRIADYGRGPAWMVIFVLLMLNGAFGLVLGIGDSDLAAALRGAAMLFTGLGAFALNRSVAMERRP